jgi:hypothetical protein
MLEAECEELCTYSTEVVQVSRRSPRGALKVRNPSGISASLSPRLEMLTVMDSPILSSESPRDKMARLPRGVRTSTTALRGGLQARHSGSPRVTSLQRSSVRALRRQVTSTTTDSAMFLSAPHRRVGELVVKAARTSSSEGREAWLLRRYGVQRVV